MQQLSISTPKKKAVLDITEFINQYLEKSYLNDGLCSLFVKHTTAAITTADLDPGTDLDMIDAFDAIMPRLQYRHPHNPEHVTDHILASIIGPSIALPVKASKLDLGSWQRVVLIELDGPRERTIIISFTKES